MALPDPTVDTRRKGSVWFPRAPSVAPDGSTGARAPIPVGPGIRAVAAPATSGAHRDDVSGYPVQYAKVQPPPLREETLARHRLLDWLAKKIHHKIVLVLADAGYGKTTLLADFAARTRLRTLWYRLDEDDRDWISLLTHLVAAGRELDSSFAPSTAAMLADTSLAGPTRDTVIGTFMRELQSIAPQGAVLIIDDFHLVDEAPDARLIARELVINAPERLTIVFASRRTPAIPIAKLRATGEVAELTTDDLRFDARETEQLFRETYGRTLDPDVLADVTARTEGWAASLQLVHAALRDRSPAEIRGFVRGLTGADHELYDYLAEVVVGDLPDDMQQFLMRTSILQVVTAEFAEVVSGVSEADVSRLLSTAERVTLLGRRSRGPHKELRYHPLVREFLEARMDREDGPEAIRGLHRMVAAYAAERDWRVAAHHFWSAGDRPEALDLIDSAAKGIIGRGEYLVAAPFLVDIPDSAMRANFEVVLSRRDFKEGDVRGALARAERAVVLDPQSDIALANLSSISLTIGHVEAAASAAARLIELSTDPVWIAIGDGLLTLIDSAVDGNMEGSRDRLRRLADQHRTGGQTHFEGISLLNLAETFRALASPGDSLEAARASIVCFEASSHAAEASSARAIAAWALMHRGEVAAAGAELQLALEETHPAIRVDVLTEAAQIEAMYGDLTKATGHLLEVQRDDSFQGLKAHLAPMRAYIAMRQGRDASEWALSDQEVSPIWEALPEPAYVANPREPELVLPTPPSGFFGIFGRKKHVEAVESAKKAHEQALEQWRVDCAIAASRRELEVRSHEEAEARRLEMLERERQRYDHDCAALEQDVAQSNEKLETLIANLGYGVADAVNEYVSIVLSNSVYPEHFQVTHEFEYIAANAELQLKVLLPGPSEMSDIKGYKYSKATDEILSVALSQKEMRERYASAVHQIAIRSFHEVFESDRRGLICTISLEVGTNTIDPATGQLTYLPFVFAAAERKLFLSFDLSAVVPALTLTRLGAAMSKNPFSLTTAERAGNSATMSRDAPVRFNPPPGWPKPPAGWTPPRGWSPDPSWPSPPVGWELWVPRFSLGKK